MLKKKSYLFSRATGALANSLYGMVFIWWLQIQTNKSSLVGLTNAIFSVTAALSIFYGPIIDNHSFKKTSQNSLLIQTILLFLLTVAIIYFKQNIALAILLAGLLSICDEFFNPADRAILKETVTDNQSLTNLISKISIIDQAVNIAGTALSGALLICLTSGQVILSCACLSLLSLIILHIALRDISSNKKDNSKTTNSIKDYKTQVFAGIKYIFKNKFLHHYFWSSILYSFASPALLIILPKVAQSLGSAVYYSTFYICFIIGFLCGALLCGKLKAKVKTISTAWILSSIPLFLMLFFISNWIVFSFLILVFGFLTSLQDILSESMIQIASNDEYLGRVLTTIRTSTSIGGPISSILAGILLDISGYNILILACAIFILCGGINILFATTH